MVIGNGDDQGELYLRAALSEPERVRVNGMGEVDVIIDRICPPQRKGSGVRRLRPIPFSLTIA